jgi:hypothetical protein
MEMIDEVERLLLTKFLNHSFNYLFIIIRKSIVLCFTILSHFLLCRGQRHVSWSLGFWVIRFEYVVFEFISVALRAVFITIWYRQLKQDACLF